MSKLLKGEIVAQDLYKELKTDLRQIKSSGVQPELVVVLVGDDPTSLSYIAVKRKKAAELGIKFNFFHFTPDLPQDELCKKIVELNRIKHVCGIIIQLPLPAHYNRQQILDCVLPGLDIDGLTSANQIKLTSGTPSFVPPAPAAILAILDKYDINLTDQHVVIVGSGDLVGKPLSKLLIQKGITVSVATAQTKNLKTLTKNADVLISAAGHPKLITTSMVKKGVVVIDAGTSFSYKGDKVTLVGDVDFRSVAPKSSAITPVPGGVGPVTVAMLFRNLVLSCKRMME